MVDLSTLINNFFRNRWVEINDVIPVSIYNNAHNIGASMTDLEMKTFPLFGNLKYL